MIDWLRNRLARKGPAADRKAVLLESGESSGRIEGPKPDGRVTPLTPDDRLRPEKPSPESFCAQAESLRARGMLQEARKVIEDALQEYPSDAGLNYRLGLLLLATGDPEQAVDLCNLALHYEPGLYAACNAKAKALEALGRFPDAMASIAQFLDGNPGHLEASIALADQHYRRGEHKALLDILDPLVKGEEVDRNVANLLGLVLGRELGEFERAEVLLHKALKNDPDWLPALTNLGWTLLEQGRHEEGYELVDRALAKAPQDVEARMVRACMKLKQGNFAEGWRDYGARHASRFAVIRPYGFTLWKGQALQGKTLLIYGEQGVGDQIMFASCFNEVIDQAGRVIIECNPKLVALFQRSFPKAQIQENVPAGQEPRWLEDAGQIDFQIAMGDLPGMYRNRWEDFPAHSGYLFADQSRVEYWKTRLAALGSEYTLGISWRGGSIATRRHLRSLTLEQMLPILHLPLRAISLQYDPVDAELSAFRESSGMEVIHWQDAIDDYDETAALVSALDGVVTVCTAAVHLAGALGKKTWVVAPLVTEWRYLEEGQKLPWYPSVTLIRQRTPGSWSGAIEETRQTLAMELARRADSSR